MFWDKKETIDYKRELEAIKIRMTRIETEILDIATAQDAIRDKVMRKIRLKEQIENDVWGGIPLSPQN
jgi:hypothetical protein